LIDELAYPVTEKSLTFRKVKIHRQVSRLQGLSVSFQNGLGL